MNELTNNIENLYKDLVKSHKPEHREIISLLESLYNLYSCLVFLKNNSDKGREQEKMLLNEFSKVEKRLIDLIHWKVNLTRYRLDYYGGNDYSRQELVYELYYLYEKNI